MDLLRSLFYIFFLKVNVLTELLRITTLFCSLNKAKKSRGIKWHNSP